MLWYKEHIQFSTTGVGKIQFGNSGVGKGDTENVARDWAHPLFYSSYGEIDLQHIEWFERQSTSIFKLQPSSKWILGHEKWHPVFHRLKFRLGSVDWHRSRCGQNTVWGMQNGKGEVQFSLHLQCKIECVPRNFRFPKLNLAHTCSEILDLFRLIWYSSCSELNFVYTCSLTRSVNLVVFRFSCHSMYSKLNFVYTSS